MFYSVEVQYKDGDRVCTVSSVDEGPLENVLSVLYNEVKHNSYDGPVVKITVTETQHLAAQQHLERKEDLQLTLGLALVMGVWAVLAMIGGAR